MSIRISPEELYFPPPLDREITNVLRLNNNSTTGGVVAYKVKTTAPQRYCVKPRVGYVKPQSEVNIHITLQPQKESFERIKDKFLFEFMRFTQEESDNISIQDLTVNWTRYESKIVKKQKLKCQFASPSPNANATVIFGESGAVSSSQADRSPDHSRRSWEPQVKETTNLTNEVNITTEGEKEDLFVSSIQEQPIQRRDLDLPTEVIQEDITQSAVPQNSHAQEVIQEIRSQKPDIEQIISHPTQRLEESHGEETQEVQIQPDHTQEQQDHSTNKSQEIVQHTEEPEKIPTKIVNAPLDLTSETRHTVEQHTAELQHKLERIEQGVNDELQSRYKMALNKMAELQSENTELHKEIKSLKAKCVSLLNSQQSELVQRKKTDLGSVKGESTTIPSSQKQLQLQQGQPPQNPSVMWMIVALVALVFFVLGKLL